MLARQNTHGVSETGKSGVILTFEIPPESLEEPETTPFPNCMWSRVTYTRCGLLYSAVDYLIKSNYLNFGFTFLYAFEFTKLWSNRIQYWVSWTYKICFSEFQPDCSWNQIPLPVIYFFWGNGLLLSSSVWQDIGVTISKGYNGSPNPGNYLCLELSCCKLCPKRSHQCCCPWSLEILVAQRDKTQPYP